VWGLAAQAWRHTGQLDLPPLYPALSAALSALGTALPSAAQGVSRACGVLVPAAVFGGARWAGATRRSAFFTGAAAALAPDLVVESLTVQPEALVALLYAAAAAGGLVWAGRASPGGRVGLLLFAASVALLGLAREHGLALLLPAACFAGAVAPRGMRLGAGVLVLAVAQLAPALLGVSVLRVPGTWPWAQKVTVVLEDLRLLHEGHLPSYLQATVDSYPTGRDAALAALRCAYTPDLARAIALNVARAVLLAGDLYLLLLLGVVGAAARFAPERLTFAGLVRSRSAWALAALALSIAPSALVWSQRRHASVLIPVALLGVALGSTALRRRSGWWIALALGAAGQLGVAIEAPAWLHDQADGRRAEAVLGLRLRDGYDALATPRALVAGSGGIVALYADLPFVVAEVNPVAPDAGWGSRTVLLGPVAEDPPQPAWAPIGGTSTLEAWRGPATPSGAVAARTAWFPVERGVRPLVPLSAPTCSAR
jgi:hypothetical protein